MCFTSTSEVQCTWWAIVEYWLLLLPASFIDRVFISCAKRMLRKPTSDSCTTTIKWRHKTHSNQNYRHYQSHRMCVCVWELHSLAMKWRNKMRFVSPQVLQCKFTTCRLWAPAHTLHTAHGTFMHWRNKHSHKIISLLPPLPVLGCPDASSELQNAANRSGINSRKLT